MGIRDRYGAGMIAWVLKGNKDGWVLSQQGNSYELVPVEQDEQPNTYRIETDNGEVEIIEDNLGLMHLYEGEVPLGLHLEGKRPVVDAQAATRATAANQKVTDGGELQADQPVTLEEIRNHLKVGSVPTQGGGRVHIVNPFHREDDESDIVDLRATMRLFKNAADSKTPVKAAKNAVEAERAVQGMDWGAAAQITGLIAAFLMGAITVEFIAGSGGGSGGGLDVGLMLSTFAMALPF